MEHRDRRAMFAAAALSGLIARGEGMGFVRESKSRLVKEAWEYAEEMFKSEPPIDQRRPHRGYD